MTHKVVPPPRGLCRSIRPPRASTRSFSPKRPVPPENSAPPTPSSATVTRNAPSTVLHFGGHRNHRRPRVLGRVGQCLGDDVVGADLDLIGQPFLARAGRAERGSASGGSPRATLGRGRPRSESPDEYRATDRAVPQVRRVPARWHGPSRIRSSPASVDTSACAMPKLQRSARPAAAGRRRAGRVRSGGGSDRRRPRPVRVTPRARSTAGRCRGRPRAGRRSD